MTPRYFKSLAALSRETGIPRCTLDKYARKAKGFPKRVRVAGQKVWDGWGVCRWYKQNVRTKFRNGKPSKACAGVETFLRLFQEDGSIRKEPESPPSSCPASPATLTLSTPPCQEGPDSAQFVRILCDPSAEPLDVTRAAMRLSAFSFAQCREPKALENLKTSLEELRRAESGYLKLKEQKGLLYNQDDVLETCALVAVSWKELRATLETQMVKQILLWREDETFLKATTESAQRQIRQFIARIADKYQHDMTQNLETFLGKGGTRAV